MKAFGTMEVDEAKELALAGGQSLHLHRIIVDRSKAPWCFVAAVNPVGSVSTHDRWPFAIRRDNTIDGRTRWSWINGGVNGRDTQHFLPADVFRLIVAEEYDPIVPDAKRFFLPFRAMKALSAAWIEWARLPVAA